MEGAGIYTWQDGRSYEGEYKDDKKHGYGIYKWTDGRIYYGWWYKGKQHGLGLYKMTEEGLKYGLWEEGKRIEWFDKEVADKITSKEIDYKQYFRNN